MRLLDRGGLPAGRTALSGSVLPARLCPDGTDAAKRALDGAHRGSFPLRCLGTAKARFKQLVLDSGGTVSEEMGEWKDCCAFVFPDMPGSFLRDVYWWMAEHGCGEEVYAQYSVLEHMDTEMTVSALREKTRLDISVDDTHPVLLLQLAPASSLAQVTEALASACGREGWTLCVK